jgi:hypothetical protein
MLSYYYTYNSEFHAVIINAIKPEPVHTIFGYTPIGKSTSNPLLEEIIYEDSPEELTVTLFKKTVSKLRDRNIQTVFIFSPCYATGDYRNLNSYIVLKEIIDDNGYSLIEDFYHAPSLMHDYYYKDKDHLTEEGVDYYSRLVAHQLKMIVKE